MALYFIALVGKLALIYPCLSRIIIISYGNNINNYKAITLSPVIAKPLELAPNL